MVEKIFIIIAAISVYIIVTIVADFKIKSFIPEVYYNIFIVGVYFFIIVDIGDSDGLIPQIFDAFVFLLIPVSIVGTYTVLKKKRIYYFKAIDKKFIKENNKAILQIIEDYENNLNIDNESSITLDNTRIIFHKLNQSQIEGCLQLIGNYINDNREKLTAKGYLIYYAKTVGIPAIITLAAIVVVIKFMNYRPPIEVSEKINIKNEYLVGNTESNINNYGMVAEAEDFIYYAREGKIYRTDINFENDMVIFDELENLGKDTINVVEDWIFFRQGKEINRIKTDGTNNEILFIGYSLQMQVVGNWIYFISIEDDSKICRIDVNGQNKQLLSDKDIEDMAVYKGKIYYSYNTKEDGFLEVMNTDGTDKQFLSNIRTRNMIVDEEYIYYLADVEEILYRMSLKDKSRERLSNKQILKFIKDDNHIFYTLKNVDNEDWRFKGLYKMNVDGSNVTALDSEIYLDEVGMAVTKDYVFFVSTNGKNLPELKIINKDGVRLK